MKRTKFKKIQTPVGRLMKWLAMTADEILNKFEQIPGAIRVGQNQEQFLFIPGERKDKVVLIAHCDTVFDHKFQELELGINNNIISSKNSKIGIGADDRAGIAILWEMRNSGHSILIPHGEESGCIGSRFLSDDKGWSELINSHRFALEFDRRGDKDIVMYDVGSKALLNYLTTNIFTGFSYSSGSYTDICQLCKKMAGANISVGYYNQHSHSETLRIDEWENTLLLTKNLISALDIPRFDIKDDYETRYNHRSSYFNSHIFEPDEIETPVANSYLLEIIKSIIKCKACDGICMKSEILENKGLCLYCGVKYNVNT